MELACSWLFNIPVCIRKICALVNFIYFRLLRGFDKRVKYSKILLKKNNEIKELKIKILLTQLKLKLIILKNKIVLKNIIFKFLYNFNFFMMWII